jgi:DNA-binding LacI/PurR family transcriptional regulator
VRLEDLARQCGVSVSTASRALAGGKGVKPELRARILEAAKTLNYAVPTSIADRKVILAASSVAMVDYVRNQFTFYVLEGLKARAQALGVEILTRPISSPAEEIGVLKEARDNHEVAGCLFLTLDDEDMLTLATDFEKPIVLVNGDDPAMRLSSVTPCNRSAARLATEHLIRLGHRRILFLMRPGRRTIERRFEGCRTRCASAGRSSLTGWCWRSRTGCPNSAQPPSRRGSGSRGWTSRRSSRQATAWRWVPQSGWSGLATRCRTTSPSWGWTTCRRPLSTRRH